MEEGMDYSPEEAYCEEIYNEEPEESYTDETEDTGDTEEQPEQGETVPAPSESVIQERIDNLLDQIGAGQSYGSMGDYYVAEAGCYAFPGEDVFFHFIEEEARPGWIPASNGCYVPVDLLEVYEAYLSSGITKEEDAEGEEGEGMEPLPPPITQEDLVSLEGILNGIYGQAETYYETSILHMEASEAALEDVKQHLANIFIVDMVICFFLALLCGAVFADAFWKRMRAG